MSKRQFKAQASAARVGAGAGAFGAFGGSTAFGSASPTALSYVQETPDYSGIADPNAVVTFKNLSKKDSTTKAKALEDLQALIAASSDSEEGVLETWVKLYPRLSIDTSRRVRQLAHTVNGQICARYGKRSVPVLPRIVGPWSAGQFDSDRATAKAAQEAFETVFPSPDKVRGLRKTFQGSIVEYCRDTILKETVHTLSDERTVSREDADTTFARVVSSSLAVISSLLDELSSDELDKHMHLYEELFASEKLWALAYDKDVLARKAMHKLLQIMLRQHDRLVGDNLSVVSTAYLYKGLSSDQTGCSTDYVQALSTLTERLPSVWTSAYVGKKPVISRLKHLLKHGSYSGTIAFWDELRKLFVQIPPEVWPQSSEDIQELLSAMRNGVALKEERFNASSTWPAYYQLVNTLTKNLDRDTAEAILDMTVLPVIRQYLQPSPQTADWSISASKAPALVAQTVFIQMLSPLLAKEWSTQASQLVETAKLSQPEQSKDFAKSQTHVATCGERWANLQRELLLRRASIAASTIEEIVRVNVQIIIDCIDLLKSREGKPFGVAATIEELLRRCGDDFLADDNVKTAVSSLSRDCIPIWLHTPSQRHLLRILHTLHSQPYFEAAFGDTLRAVVQDVEGGSGNFTVELAQDLFPRNLSRDAIRVAHATPELQRFADTLAQGQDEDSRGAAIFVLLVERGILTNDAVASTLSVLTNALRLDDAAQHKALSLLESISQKDATVLYSFMAESEDSGKQLLPNILRLEQSVDDQTAEKATALSLKLSSAMGKDGPETQFSLVQQNLERPSASSLPIDALHELVLRLLGSSKEVPGPAIVLPNLDSWAASLSGATRAPLVSLALLSPLGGAVYLANRSGQDDTQSVTQADAEGLSQALRIGIYVSRLLKDTDLMKKIESDVKLRANVLAMLYLTSLLADDNLSISGANALWDPSRSRHIEPLVTDFITDVNSVLNQFWSEIKPEAGCVPYVAFLEALKSIQTTGQLSWPTPYYFNLASANANANLFEMHGHSTQQVKDCEQLLKESRSSADTLATTATIIAYQLPLASTALLDRYGNELVADLTDLDVSTPASEEKGMRRLILLNTILNSQEHFIDGVAKQRLIFLVKRLVPLLNSGGTPWLTIEICKALAFLLPGVHDLYGEHWMQVLSYLLGFWGDMSIRDEDGTVDECRTLLMHGSLRLLGCLQRLVRSEEPNDDLLDAMKECHERISSCLIQLLKSENGLADADHQPLSTTHGLLYRQILQLSNRSIRDAEELFPLIYTPSRSIQQAAFHLLHQHIPSTQEQISFDAALDDKKASLPDELLSLIMEAPTLDSLADLSFDRGMPLELQGYLYSWRLLFDHFENSSYRVKNDYIDQLKDGAHLSGLLDLTFDFLGHTRGRPVDASKFDMQTYTPDVEPSAERDVQWLLVHLYYLALTYMPSAVKVYYLELRSRQTSMAVESWTAKFISPAVAAHALEAVTKWSRTSVEEDPEYEKMSVKVGLRSREIGVNYVVDEQTMAIKVVLPEAYPLASAQVVSVHRVAVREEKWQSWLRNCQGVIVFSNGSITDGLAAWRRNVTGALKGQTECAICYSIISADRQLPTKRCPTCKNLFHSSCLFKWFKTSNASTCPLCRNPFSFG